MANRNSTPARVAIYARVSTKNNGQDPAVVVAFFVAIPQCFGQDAEQSPGQLLEEEQLVQMSLLLMAPPTFVAVPVLMAPPDMVTIFHFKTRRKHCPDDSGGFLGGGEITINRKQLQKHLAHGDCTEDNYDPAPADCDHHCVANSITGGPLCSNGE